MQKNLYERAKDRMDEMGWSEDEMAFIFSDWPEGEEHYQWLLTAERAEIQSWINSSK